MNRLTMLLVGMVATLALLAAACGTGSEDEDTPVSQPTVGGTTPSTEVPMDHSVSGVPLDMDAKYGGILKVSQRSTNPLNPWEEAAGPAFDVAHLLNNMLIKPRTWGTEDDYKNAAFFELHPDLAETWEQSPNGLAWTFNLRDGIEWSDGTPLSCNDVKWSFDTIRLADAAGLNRSPRKTHYLAIRDITCADELTVVFNLIYPKPAILEVIGQPYNVIFPAHIYQTEFNETGGLLSMRQEPATVTTGAFRVVEYIPGEGYLFERNADYWDQPFPYIDAVEMIFLSRANIPPALRTGAIHIGDSHGYTGGQALTLLQECMAEFCKIYDRAIASSFSPAMFLNKNREPWNNPAINEAFALAIDNQKYITTVQQDLFELPDWLWLLPDERMGNAGCALRTDPRLC